MIEMEDIKKSFKLADTTVAILKGISLTIGKGEFVSIMGPSGSGKSTLSSILGCLATPTTGTYRIDGNNITTLSSNALANLRNKKIGFIFQDFNLLDGLSAVENVGIPLFYAGVRSKERRERASQCLKTVGLEAKLNHLPNQLSGGQKQRVAIARALVNEPSFLFADEPTGALDKRTGREIMGLMQRLNLLGHTIVQVTHSIIDANFSKRILHLVDGFVVKDEYVERPTAGDFGSLEGQTGEVEARIWRMLQTSKAPFADFAVELNGLLKATTSQDSMIEAVRALMKWESPQAKQLLERLSQSEFWGVRAEIIRSSGTKPKGESMRISLDGLKDPNAWVRYLAISQLKRSLPFEAEEPDRKTIIACTDDEDERVRATSIALLSQWDDPGVVKFLLKACDDKDGRVRANAVDGLSLWHKKGYQPETIIEKVKSHIDDKNNRTRANAALLYFRKNPDEALDALTKMMLSENNLMRASAAWALGLIPIEKSSRLVYECMKSEKEELVLNQLIRSLGILSQGVYPAKLIIEDFLSVA